MRIKLSLAASALALGLGLAGTASAQDYTRHITFGDSLSDIGNLYAASGGTQPLSPPYYQGRFSNGLVWVELIGMPQARVGGSVTGGYNGAYGGSRTDNLTAFPPGMRQQITNYLAAGGTFRSTDLVTIWGGANNLFQGFTPASVNADPIGYINGVAAASAGDIGFMINQVTTAGAGTVLVPNLPNLGATPQFAGGPAQTLATAATNTFNAALMGQLRTQAAAHPTSNIILMDVNRAFAMVTAAPGRFGFTNASQPCLVGLTVCATPDSYVFWDGVHPTAAGHRLVASVATDYIYYGDYGAHSAVQAEIAGRAREDGLDMATSRLGHQGFAGRAGGVYVGGTYETGDLDARGDIQGGELSGSGLVIGIEDNIGESLRGGVAFSARTADVNLTRVDFTAQGAAFDAYLGWRSGAIFVNAAVGYSWDQYDDINRQTATAGVIATSSTRGETLGARVEGGYALSMGDAWQVAPRVALTYTSSEVERYVEENPFGAAHQFASRSYDIVSGEVAVRAEGDLGGIGLWGEVGYRDALDSSGDDVSVGLVGNTARPLSVAVDDPNGGQMLLSAGLSADWGPATVSVGYRGRSGDTYETHVGMAQVTMRF